jgi:dihydrofolate reductase
VSNAGAHLVGAATYAEWAWGETTIAAGDLTDAITRLKQERPGGYLLAQGGVRFARSLIETGLIDEYRLVVHPVVLGTGERLFSAPLTIEPMSTTVFSGGGVGHVFAAHP